MKKRNRTACLMLFAGFVLCGFLGAQDGFLSPTVAAPAAAESIQLEQIQIQSGTFTAVRAAPPMQPASCSLCPKRSLNV